jgi:hypothetical protein
MYAIEFFPYGNDQKKTLNVDLFLDIIYPSSINNRFATVILAIVRGLIA